MTRAGTIVTVNCWLAVALALSVTSTVKVNEPAALGIPSNVPLAARLKPVGRAPEVSAKLYGAAPPLAGQAVRVTASGVTLAAAPAPAEKSFLAQVGGFFASIFGVSEVHAADFSQTYISDSRGQFVVRVDSSFAGPGPGEWVTGVLPC